MSSRSDELFDWLAVVRQEPFTLSGATSSTIGTQNGSLSMTTLSRW